MTKAEAVAALAQRPVPFSACGADLHILPMSLCDRLTIGGYAEAHPDAASADLWALTFALSVCGPDGARPFAGPDAAAMVAEVKSLPIQGAAVEAVARAAVELSRAPDPKA